MKKFYEMFCRIEELVTGIFLCIIVALVFLSALARAVLHPLNWAQDVSLLLFAWVVFLGADVALRKADFVNVDMFIKQLSSKIQLFFYYTWNIVIVSFLAVLIRFGIPLTIENYKRLFQALGISYSWAAISVPVGSSLMIITIILKLLREMKKSNRKVNV